MEKQAALLIIDVQKVIVEYSYQGEEVVGRIQSVIREARDRHLPILYVQHTTGHGGPLALGSPLWNIHDSVAPLAGDPVYQKLAADSFFETPLHEKLTELGVEKLIVAGFQTEYCVDTTTRRAVSLGYDVTLVSDCHSTADGPVLKAADIIVHHNTTLQGLATPKNKVTVKESASLWE